MVLCSGVPKLYFFLAYILHLPLDVSFSWLFLWKATHHSFIAYNFMASNCSVVWGVLCFGLRDVSSSDRWYSAPKHFSLVTLKVTLDWYGEMFAAALVAAKAIFIESLKFLDPSWRLSFHSVWVAISLVLYMKCNKAEWFNEQFTFNSSDVKVLFIMFSSSHANSSISISSSILWFYVFYQL